MQATLRFIRNGSRSAALRIVPPETGITERTSAHFIALIDVSESMNENDKLSNVKRCLSLLLDYLTPADELSLVTFGDTATILFSRLKMTPAGVATAAAAIQILETNGCTNLSAGLAAVREILQSVSESRSRLKQGLLVLTDGHANRGVFDPKDLRALNRRVFELSPGLTISYVAYGATTHNASLLKSMAEDVNGAYSIVEKIEDTALTMGEMLGGILSCVAQNVTVRLPPRTLIRGPKRPYTPDGTAVQIGDIYAGIPILLLLDFCEEEEAASATVSGAILPTLDLFSIELASAAQPDPSEPRDVEVELTELRYKCSDIYRRISDMLNGGRRRGQQEAEFDSIRGAIAGLRVALEDELYAGHTLLELLRGELPSLETAVAAAAANPSTNNHLLQTQLLQHEAFVTLGRGSSQPIEEDVPGDDNCSYSSDMTPDDPDVMTRTMNTAPARPSIRRANARHGPNTSYLSPVASRSAQRVAAQFRSAAQPR
jgi:Mg-chelatase subunit ChlD